MNQTRGTKIGQEGQFRAYAIDPEHRVDTSELVYLCPDYWDRKNQMVLAKNTTIHPITGQPIEQMLPQNKQDHDKYIISRKKDENEVSFIHDVHPQNYPLPCCGKKPVQYWDRKTKKGKKVRVLKYFNNDYHWIEGTTVGDIIREKIHEGTKVRYDRYPVMIDGKREEIHISMLDKYKEGGQGLTRVPLLPTGSRGHVSDILKSIFHIPYDDPMLNKTFKMGFSE